MPEALLENIAELPDVARVRSKVAANSERRRKQIVSLVFLIFWALIFEGVLRKWVFPQYQRFLFFLRDPMVILTYILSLRYGLGPRLSPFFLIGVVFAILTWFVVVVQYALEPRFYWILAFYGYRNYFLYLPLAFVIARCVKLEDLERLMRQTLWVSIPIAVLVFLQFTSAPSAPINQGFGDDSENRFSGLALVSGKIRPLGTFTSNQGQSPFVAGCVAMMFIAWMTRSLRSRMTILGLIAVTCSTLSCVALSGSRTTVMWSGLVVVSAIPAALLAARKRSPFPMLAAPILIVFGGLIILPVAFPDAINAFAARWTDANRFEKERHGDGGVFARAVDDLGIFRYIMSENRLHGYQIGLGGNAANLLGIQNSLFPLESDMQGAALESEWGRHAVDLGILGIGFILYRIAFVVWLCRECVRGTMRTGNAHPLLLFGFVGILLFNGQITGQGAQNGFAWLFAGFTLAACQSKALGDA